jgi:two-component system chemotaxis response regulator CheB
MLINPGGTIELWRGPKENNFRPAINALFRSAAVAYGRRVTGVILSGNLEDGTAGLWWIKRMEGAWVVQDPMDAEFAQMPQTALWHVHTDYVVKLADLGPTLTKLANGVRRIGERDEELAR